MQEHGLWFTSLGWSCTRLEFYPHIVNVIISLSLWGVVLLLGSAEHDEVPTSEALDGVSKLGKLVSFAFYLGQHNRL